MIPLDTGPPHTLDTRGPNERQDELLRARSPSLWEVLFVVIIAVGAVVWLLIRG